LPQAIKNIGVRHNLSYINHALGKIPPYVGNANYIVVAFTGAGLVTKHNSVKEAIEEKKPKTGNFSLRVRQVCRNLLIN